MLLFDDFRGKIAPTFSISEEKEKLKARKAAAEKLGPVLDRLVSILEASTSRRALALTAAKKNKTVAPSLAAKKKLQ